MIAFKISLNIEEIPIIEDQSRNGVKVLVHRYSYGTYVEKDCSCMGSNFRVHDNLNCPNLKRLKFS